MLSHLRPISTPFSVCLYTSSRGQRRARHQQTWWPLSMFIPSHRDDLWTSTIVKSLCRVFFVDFSHTMAHWLSTAPCVFPVLLLHLVGFVHHRRAEWHKMNATKVSCIEFKWDQFYVIYVHKIACFAFTHRQVTTHVSKQIGVQMSFRTFSNELDSG